MFTDKLGGIELPHLQNIKIEKIPIYLQHIRFWKIKSKLYKFFFCILSNAERIICSRKCIFDEISGKFLFFFKTSLAIWGQISRLLVGKLNSERNLESNY